ncbi:hypothetical protein T265_09829 [Opisthorchis viverrini]|uniref:Peptidase C13 family protein n=1 Tax=Opisthorchis viverrini TaxID=6198 RepID=A0A074Z4I4_OPIVI|nr:hypothetical protein T265_09829 [Opisthorchis viverrini]KER21978.1 hypothetical protein T265_09829 [Opisthorchis viverrini]
MQNDGMCNPPHGTYCCPKMRRDVVRELHGSLSGGTAAEADLKEVNENRWHANDLQSVKADVYRAYHVVRKNKVPAQNVITFAYDDIANNPSIFKVPSCHDTRRLNEFLFTAMFPKPRQKRSGVKGRAGTTELTVGKVFHDYQHVDIYHGVIIDYRGKDVTRDNFVKVLKGDDKLEANKKVLKSGPNDNVFIFYTGHGGTSHITFPKEYLHAMELNDTLAYMHSKKMFNKLVLYVDSCNAGSMFRDVLPSNMGIYVTTAAKEDELSYSLFCLDNEIDVCLADEYSYVWLLDSEYNDLKTHTLEEQYVQVKRDTMLSHVMKYGEMAMGRLPVGKFQGHYDLPMHRNDGRYVPQHTTHLMELCKAGYNPETLIESVHNVCS